MMIPTVDTTEVDGQPQEGPNQAQPFVDPPGIAQHETAGQIKQKGHHLLEVQIPIDETKAEIDNRFKFLLICFGKLLPFLGAEDGHESLNLFSRLDQLETNSDKSTKHINKKSERKVGSKLFGENARQKE